MACDKEIIEFIAEQIVDAGEIRYIKLFGEYAIYSDDKLFGLICENKLFVKPTQIGRDFINNVIEAPPYPGAKNYFFIEDGVDDSDWLSELVRRTVTELPLPKPKKKKVKRGKIT